MCILPLLRKSEDNKFALVTNTRGNGEIGIKSLGNYNYHLRNWAERNQFIRAGVKEKSPELTM